jgi:hypothetical protein
MHKLSAPWEGPFVVTEVISPLLTVNNCIKVRA